jgi:hypothetical protein
MIKNWIYQDTRLGPPAYDVVSILWDPYYRLEDDIRAEFLDYYIRKMKKSYTDQKCSATNPLLSHFSKEGQGDFLLKVSRQDFLRMNLTKLSSGKLCFPAGFRDICKPLARMVSCLL